MPRQNSPFSFLKVFGAYLLYRLVWGIGMTIAFLPVMIGATYKKMDAYTEKYGAFTAESLSKFYNETVSDVGWMQQLMGSNMTVIMAGGACLTLVCGAIIFFIMKNRRKKRGIILHERREKNCAGRRWLFAAAAALGVGAGFLAVLMRIALLSAQGQSAVFVNKIQGGGVGVLFAFVVFCIFVPLSEEIFFRGILYAKLKETNAGGGFWYAAVYSALFYGLQEQSIGEMILYAAVGVAAVMVYRMYDTLWAPVLLHFAVAVCTFFAALEPVLRFLASNLLFLCAGAVAGVTVFAFFLMRMWNSVYEGGRG